MNPEAVCRSLLHVVDAIPSDIPWHVSTTDDVRLIFVTDTRPEVSTIELAAIAGDFGVVVAQSCIQSRRLAGRSIIGALVEIPVGTDPVEASDRLRGAYLLSVGDPPADTFGPGGPF